MAQRSYPGKGSEGRRCYSIVINAFKGRLSAEKMRCALAKWGIHSAKDIISAYGDDDGAKITALQYIYLSGLESAIKFGLKPSELHDLVYNLHDVSLDGYSIAKILGPASAVEVDWLTTEILGRNYTAASHSRKKENTHRPTSLAPGGLAAVVRILLEGKEIGAPRVDIYEQIYSGEDIPAHGISSSAVYKKGSYLKLAGQSGDINMTAAMEKYFSDDVQDTWDEWKDDSLWQPFYKPVVKHKFLAGPKHSD